MTTDSTYKPLKLYLKRLHAHTQTIEAWIHKMIEDTEQTDREALAAEADFAVFAESEAEIDLAVFASSLADLLITIHALAASNKELQEMMQKSLAGGVANAELLGQNIEWLAEVTPKLIANFLSMIRSQGIMDDSLAELASRGEPAVMRLGWIAKWLIKKGYIKKELLR